MDHHDGIVKFKVIDKVNYFYTFKVIDFYHAYLFTVPCENFIRT
jgi:hypothetical protein